MRSLTHFLQALLCRCLGLIRHIWVLGGASWCQSISGWHECDVAYALRPPATFWGFLSPLDLSMLPPSNSCSRTSLECCLDSSEVSITRLAWWCWWIWWICTRIVQVRLVATDDVACVGHFDEGLGLIDWELEYMIWLWGIIGWFVSIEIWARRVCLCTPQHQKWMINEVMQWCRAAEFTLLDEIMCNPNWAWGDSWFIGKPVGLHRWYDGQWHHYGSNCRLPSSWKICRVSNLG